MVGGLIYGFFLYKRKISFINVLCAELFVKIICNLGMNSFLIIITTGKAFNAIMPARVISNAGKLPADVVIMLLLLPVINKVVKPQLENNSSKNSTTEKSKNTMEITKG